MALTSNKIIQFRDRVTDASVYPIGRMEIVFDSSGYNLNTYITEYNVNAHDGSANSGNNYMSDNVYTLEQAIAMLPPEYKRAGIKLTFKDSSNGGAFTIYRTYDGVEFIEVKEDQVEPFVLGTAAKTAILNGSSSQATAQYSVAEGNGSKAEGYASHAEGNAEASGQYSHAEGYVTTAGGDYSHAEGNNTIASGDYSHAEGDHTIASGDYSHAEGIGTVTDTSGGYAGGRYNSAINAKSIHSIGIGTSNSDRRNAVDVTTDGSIYVYGVGNYQGIIKAGTDASTIQEIINSKREYPDRAYVANSSNLSIYVYDKTIFVDVGTLSEDESIDSIIIDTSFSTQDFISAVNKACGLNIININYLNVMHLIGFNVCLHGAIDYGGAIKPHTYVTYTTFDASWYEGYTVTYKHQGFSQDVRISVDLDYAENIRLYKNA